MPKPFNDLTGQVFGNLIAISMIRFKNSTKWFCKCICQKVVCVASGNLTSGNSKSCGCITKVKKHKDSNSSEYNTWLQINQRCANKNCKEYRNYGGRGIVVCERWNPKTNKDAYKNFLEDMGRRPKKDYSIDRINNNDGYNPKNCQWVDKKSQRLNQRSRINWITYEGKTLCVSDWARELGISRNAFSYRLKKYKDIYSVISNPNLIR